GGLSGNLDEKKKSKGSCIYEAGCHENQGFVGHGICRCEYVTEFAKVTEVSSREAEGKTKSNVNTMKSTI
ncbi:hypothetical protein Tco_1552647, partial [Tanacetum coccineum]